MYVLKSILINFPSPFSQLYQLCCMTDHSKFSLHLSLSTSLYLTLPTSPSSSPPLSPFPPCTSMELNAQGYLYTWFRQNGEVVDESVVLVVVALLHVLLPDHLDVLRHARAVLQRLLHLQKTFFLSL